MERVYRRVLKEERKGENIALKLQPKIRKYIIKIKESNGI